MEKLVKGDIIVVQFPFSDLSATKKRPAIIVATLQGDDIICCQITSEARHDQYSLILKNEAFQQGSLKQTSMIRPNRIFTADTAIIAYKVGNLKDETIKEIEKSLISIFTD